VFEKVASLGAEVLDMRAGVMGLQGFVTAPFFDHVEGMRIGEVLVQVVLTATGLSAGRFQQRTQVLFEGVLLAGFGDEGGDGGKRLGHVRLRERDEFDGTDNWLFLCKIKPAKRAVSFNVFLIIEAEMLRFDDLQLFVRAADLGSLSAAARGMDMSAAVASAALKRIEQQLGARLLARSTRSLRLTAEGEGFLEYARAALSSLDEGRRLLASGQDQVSGILQLSAPSDFGRNLLLPWLDEFQREHPKLTVRLLLGDRIADLFRQPVDIALRYGEPEDSSLVALPIAPQNRRVLCAAPSYLARHGEPRQLEQLAQHNCLLFMLGSRVHDHWSFHDGKREVSLTVSGDRFSDDADVVRLWAVAGAGIAYKSWLDVAADVLAGRLKVLMPELLCERAPLNLLCAHRAQLSKPVNLLREMLASRCARLSSQFPTLSGPNH
jgi:DNA-binding transcriptional LysR family regulator